jgi:hypothetical protein
MKSVFSFLFLIYSLWSYSQCDYSVLIPFEIGMSKFDINTIRNTSGEYKNYSKNTSLLPHEIESLDDVFEKTSSSFRNYDYLNEPVLKTYFSFYNSSINCNSIDEILYKLYLVDDYLYKIEAIIRLDSYNKLISVYNNLLDLIPDEYLYLNNSVYKNEFSEKVGEGVDFFKDNIDQNLSDKLDYVSVSYLFNYEKVFDSSGSFVYSSKITDYTLSIYSVNLKNTKLTKEGF